MVLFIRAQIASRNLVVCHSLARIAIEHEKVVIQSCALSVRARSAFASRYVGRDGLGVAWLAQYSSIRYCNSMTSLSSIGRNKSGSSVGFGEGIVH